MHGDEIQAILYYSLWQYSATGEMPQGCMSIINFEWIWYKY